MTRQAWASSWTLTIAAATLCDFAVRFALPFDLKRVLLTETVLFPATGLVLLWLVRRFPRRRGWKRVLQWVLIAAFFLGGLRSGLWGLGLSVTVANLTPLAVGVIGISVLWLRRHFNRPKRA